MINFKQKVFTEYDAMKVLYEDLKKRGGDRNKWKVIDSSALIPILKGNNVVIERFVITTTLFNRDRYRMYLKIGAKAKMPDEVRLPETVYDKKLGNASLNINVGNFGPDQRNNSDTTTDERIKLFSSRIEQKEFKGGPPPNMSANISPSIEISYQVRELLGEAVKYDKKERSLVLEFSSVSKAIDALNILPFGLNYNIYLLS